MSQLTIRQLLGLWNVGRRTAGVVAEIESDLSDRGLTTHPPFTEGWIDNTIRLVPISTEPEPDETAAAQSGGDILTADELPPVSLRIGDLKSANSPVMGVSSDETLVVAMTRMLASDYSQLAVFDAAGGVRAVSWESIAKATVAHPQVTLADATVGARIVDHDADLLAEVGEIYNVGYVLVRGPNRVTITGIVTTADLTLQFASMARPIALIEEVERRLRRRVDEVFSMEDLRAACRSRRQINSAADLTLGNYPYLLASAESFGRLGWRLDHTYFLTSLEDIRDVRNDLMHFSTTDPLTDEQLQSIAGLVNMLRTVDPRA